MLNTIKKPTETDMKVLAYLQDGNTLNHLKAINLFKTTGIRDRVYRLRKAGYFILSKNVEYKTSEGKFKRYVDYYMKNQPEKHQTF